MDVFFTIETSLDDAYTNGELELSGFMSFRKDQFGKRGGGIIAYVQHGVVIHRRVDLENDDEILAMKFLRT